jgi:Mn2+/Fe2+ NRAMP family transporter
MVLVVGALGAALGGQPLQMILLAQGANALALPWFAFLLLRLATLRSESSLLRLGPWIVLAGALGLGGARLFALL